MKKRLTISPILKTLFVIFILIGNVSFSGIAQQKRLTEKEKQEKIDSLINNSDVIVEGACYEYVTPIVIDNKLYSVTLLNISHIYKGENLPSKVFFIREEYNFCLSNENTTIIRKYKEGTSIKHHYISYGGGIFFLKKCFSPIELFDATNSDAEISLIFQTNKSIKFSPNEKYVFQPTDEYEWGIDHGINTIGSEYYGPYQKKFSCKKELLEFLHKYENIKMPDYLDESYFQNNTTITDSIKKKIIIKEDIDNFHHWLTRGQKYPQKQILKSFGVDTVNCTLFADYQRLEYNNQKYYYKFDLFVKYESNDINIVYPEEILFLFQYNSNTFGTNIVSNNKFSCYLEPTFADTLSYTIEYRDHISNNNQVALMIATKFIDRGNFDFVANRTPIQIGDKVKLATIAIEVQESVILDNDIETRKTKLSEVWNQLDFNVNRWSTDQTSYGIWDTINCMQLELNGSYILGNPYIKDISTNGIENLIGGCEEELIIKGSGFMTYSSIQDIGISPTVAFPNADGIKSSVDNTFLFTQIDSSDIIFWNDTCIIIKIPSNVYGDANNPYLRYKTIGSGNIKLINSIGYKCISSNVVTINSSILNVINSEKKQIPYWARVNCTDKVLFEVNSSISNETIKIIQYAFDEWNKLIGYTFFDFKRGSNGAIVRTNKMASVDSTNVIYYQSNNTTIDAAGIPSYYLINKNYLINCDSNHYLKKEIDLYINQIIFDNLSENDKRHCILHELGHALGLGHVLNKEDIMFPNNENEEITITSGAKNGVEKLLFMSDTINLTCTNIEKLRSTNTSCPPQTPNFINVIATQKNAILLEWDKDVKATSYTLKRSLLNNMSSAQILTIPYNTNQFLDTGLVSRTTYYYQIQANNSNGSSSFSNIKNVSTVSNDTEGKIKNFSIESNGTENITLRWELDSSTNTDIQKIIIERKVESDLKSNEDFNIIAIVNADLFFYNDYDIQEGFSYNYRIKYITNDAISKYSEPQSITPNEFNIHSKIKPISRNAQLYKNNNYSYRDVENTNYNGHEYIRTWRWTHSGSATYIRSLFDIDLSDIPTDAIIESATLEMKGIDHQTNITEHTNAYKSNASWIELVTENWDENTVTWNTQPSSSSTYRVPLENSQSRTQNYTIDITELVSQMITDTSLHGFMLRLQQEDIYTRMTFASPTYHIDSLRPFVSIKYITFPSKQLQTNPQKDATIYISGRSDQTDYEYSYFGDKETFICQAWTNSGKTFNIRSLIDFDLSSIPADATIINASLNLYSPYPQTIDMYKHFSYNITHNTGYKSNASYLCKVLQPWGEHSTTWHTQPVYDTSRSVLLPQSSDYQQDYLDINVTHLVQDMVTHPDSAFGLMMVLQNETKYARMVFASSDFPDISLHPQLTVTYKIYPQNLLKNYSLTEKENNYKAYKDLIEKTEPNILDSLPKLKIKIFPNPTNGIFYIESEQIITNIEIYNTSNMILREDNYTKRENKKYFLDISDFKKGIYLIKCSLQNGDIVTEKILLE